jgi:hypothetical protein
VSGAPGHLKDGLGASVTTCGSHIEATTGQRVGNLGEEELLVWLPTSKSRAIWRIGRPRRAAATMSRRRASRGIFRSYCPLRSSVFHDHNRPGGRDTSLTRRWGHLSPLSCNPGHRCVDCDFGCCGGLQSPKSNNPTFEVGLIWPMEGRPSATQPLGAAPAHAGRLKDGVKEDGSWGP